MANKKESTLLNMVLTLFIISLLSAGALGYVYEITKEPIRKASLKKELKAIQEVVPPFDNSPFDEKFEMEAFDGSGKLEVYPAKKDGKIVGYAVKTFTERGFGGHIDIMVGFLPNGVIENTKVLAHSETPGLGSKMTSEKFKSQFHGFNPAEKKLIVKKDGGDVDAITAATISSRAFCDALNRAYKTLQKGGKIK
jgi:electron transport complex protein RnfG